MPDSPSDLPADLRVWVVDSDTTIAVVTFSRSRCANLSDAEMEIARCAAAGMSNVEIAARRRTSVRTVANQIVSVLRKLGVGSRAELATIPEVLA
jgi:DNA-binding CsgD family transcriptional regulator